VKREKKAEDENLPTRFQLRSNLMVNSSCKIRLAIDCRYDSLMSERDIGSLQKQISFCYSANRRYKNPCQFYLTNVDGQLEERIRVNSGYNWDIHIRKEKLEDLFSKDEILYLTSESENVLSNDQLQSSNVYVIGGLVDHNSRKGLCHKLAVDNQWKHARLPIDEYLKMNSRKVLTCNHVFEILLNYIEMNDWKQAFEKHIPKRKQTQSQENDKNNCDGVENGQEENKTCDENNQVPV